MLILIAGIEQGKNFFKSLGNPFSASLTPEQTRNLFHTGNTVKAVSSPFDGSLGVNFDTLFMVVGFLSLVASKVPPVLRPIFNLFMPVSAIYFGIKGVFDVIGGFIGMFQGEGVLKSLFKIGMGALSITMALPVVRGFKFIKESMGLRAAALNATEREGLELGANALKKGAKEAVAVTEANVARVTKAIGEETKVMNEATAKFKTAVTNVQNAKKDLARGLSPIAKTDKGIEIAQRSIAQTRTAVTKELETLRTTEKTLAEKLDDAAKKVVEEAKKNATKLQDLTRKKTELETAKRLQEAKIQQLTDDGMQNATRGWTGRKVNSNAQAIKEQQTTLDAAKKELATVDDQLALVSTSNKITTLTAKQETFEKAITAMQTARGEMAVSGKKLSLWREIKKDAVAANIAAIEIQTAYITSGEKAFIEELGKIKAPVVQATDTLKTQVGGQEVVTRMAKRKVQEVAAIDKRIATLEQQAKEWKTVIIRTGKVGVHRGDNGAEIKTIIEELERKKRVIQHQSTLEYAAEKKSKFLTNRIQRVTASGTTPSLSLAKIERGITKAQARIDQVTKQSPEEFIVMRNKVLQRAQKDPLDLKNAAIERKNHIKAQQSKLNQLKIDKRNAEDLVNKPVLEEALTDFRAARGIRNPEVELSSGYKVNLHEPANNTAQVTNYQIINHGKPTPLVNEGEALAELAKQGSIHVAEITPEIQRTIRQQYGLQEAENFVISKSGDIFKEVQKTAIRGGQYKNLYKSRLDKIAEHTTKVNLDGTAKASKTLAENHNAALKKVTDEGPTVEGVLEHCYGPVIAQSYVAVGTASRTGKYREILTRFGEKVGQKVGQKGKEVAGKVFSAAA